MFNNLYGVSSCVWEQMDTGRHVYAAKGTPFGDFIEFREKFDLHGTSMGLNPEPQY